MKFFKWITGTLIQPKNVFHQVLVWGNIPFLQDNPAYLGEVIHECFLKKFKHPYILYTFNGRIRELEEFVLTEKQLAVLKNQTLHIFLYEPISFFTDSYNRGFYSEFPSDLDAKSLRAYELESIEIFAKKYNLNIVVCTCEYEIQLLQPQYKHFKLVCFDAFIRRNQRKRTNPFQHLFPRLSLIDKRFWSGNWRYTLHRHIIMAYLANFDGYYSWHFKSNFANIENNEWFNFKELPSHIAGKLERGSKISDNGYAIDNNELQVEVEELDCVYKPALHPNTGNDNKLWESYDRSFCAVVTETRFAQPFANFSEKTLIAIRAQIPFIVVAPPKTLEYVKKFGFKTFDKWWDESYDQEQDHEKRMIKILNLIEYIDSKSLEELIEIRKEMKSVLKHNYKVNQKIQYNTMILDGPAG
jgi:uncharacterized protein YeeX (DUF496 family)